MSTSLKCHKVVQAAEAAAAAQPSKGHQQQAAAATHPPTPAQIYRLQLQLQQQPSEWRRLLKCAKISRTSVTFRILSPVYFLATLPLDKPLRMHRTIHPIHPTHNLRQRNDKASCKNYFPLRDTRTSSTKRVWESERENFMKFSFRWENTCAAFLHCSLSPLSSLPRSDLWPVAESVPQLWWHLKVGVFMA